MTNERITTEAIEALELLGVGRAINEIADLLRAGDGLGKHGEQGWRILSSTALFEKLERHTNGILTSRDHDSRRHVVTHAAVRALMLVQRAKETP